MEVKIFKEWEEEGVVIRWRVEPRYLKNYDLPSEAQTDWGGVTGDQIAAARGVRPSGELNLDPVPSGRNEGYFMRTLAARRGITFLAQQPEVDPDRIGMTGHSMGGTLTHQTTAMEPLRLKASVPSDGPPIEHLHQTPQNTPRREEDKKILELARRTAMPALYSYRWRRCDVGECPIDPVGEWISWQAIRFGWRVEFA